MTDEHDKLFQEKLEVNILGRRYILSSDEECSIQQLKEIADYTVKRVEEFKEMISPRDDLKILVLTALNLADELLKLRSASGLSQKRIQELIRKCERDLMLLTTDGE